MTMTTLVSEIESPTPEAVSAAAAPRRRRRHSKMRSALRAYERSRRQPTMREYLGRIEDALDARRRTVSMSTRLIRTIVAAGLALGGSAMWVKSAMSAAADGGLWLWVIVGALLTVAGLILGCSAIDVPKPKRG